MRGLDNFEADHVCELLEDAAELSYGGLHIVQCLCSAV